jgi:hypothetical protein
MGNGTGDGDTGMIRHGRTAVDRRGVADLCGRTVWMLTHAGVWSDPRFPQPLNADPAGIVRPRPYLYDRGQVEAYVAGGAVPAMSVVDHPGDLLCDREAAAFLGISLVAFDARLHARTVPPPDTQVYGRNHRRRRTLVRHLRTPAPSGGRPGPGQGVTPRQRMWRVGSWPSAPANRGCLRSCWPARPMSR